MKTKITINRKDTFFNVFRDYKIYVNGLLVGNISNNSSFELEIEEKSKICLKIDWCSSNTIVVEPHENNVIISSNCILSGWKTFLYPLYLTIFRDRYILLSQSITSQQ